MCSGKHSRTGSRPSSAPGTPNSPTETLMQLTCRLSSLDYLLIRLPVLATSVRSRSAQHPPPYPPLQQTYHDGEEAGVNYPC